MNDDTEITTTRGKLADAFERWDAEAKVNGWQDRDDADRWRDCADYLIGILNSEAALA